MTVLEAIPGQSAPTQGGTPRAESVAATRPLEGGLLPRLGARPGSINQPMRRIPDSTSTTRRDAV